MRPTTAFVSLIVAALSAAGLFTPVRAAVVQQDTGCHAEALGATYTSPGAGVTTKGLGADAPAYYEIGSPSGAFAGKAPNGIMLVVHGGGWNVVGKDSVSAIRSYTNSWRGRGWQTVSVDYRACSQSVTDVFWFMNKIRALRPTATVCAAGISAGGQLALMLAGARSDLACAVALAAPSDLASLEAQQPALYSRAVSAFGTTTLVYASPIRYAGNVKARVLLASGAADTSVPPVQNDAYAAAVKTVRPNAYADVHLLAYGDRPFVHTGISSAAAAELRAAEDALVAPLPR